jgi:thiol-disulfide isomerase/thioredoxin
MKCQLKNIVTFFVGLLMLNAARAEQSPNVLTGTFTEKVNAELRLYRAVNNNIQNIGNYKIDPDNLDFVFALPADSVANYSLEVKIMKMGHIRLEVDKWYTVSLVLKAGEDHSLKLTPSKLAVAKKAGWELKAGSNNASIAFIKGKFNNWKFGVNVTMQRVVDGTYYDVNGIAGSKDDPFILSCVIKQEGFYYLSSPRWRQRLYLKPADKLELAIDGMTGTYEVINGSEESRMMQNWQQLISPITAFGYNRLSIPRDSFDLTRYQKSYDSLEPAISKFRNSIHYSGSKFSKLFTLSIDVDKELAPMQFLLFSSINRRNAFVSTPKDFNYVPASYHRFIQPGKFSDASMLSLGEAGLYMTLYTKLVIASLPEDLRKRLTQSEKLERMIHSISNDTLKSLFLKDQLGTVEINNLSEFNSTFAPFEKYATSTNTKQKYNAVFHQFAGDTAWLGKSSYDFALPDTSGRMVSMKDFKGKVIVIDVWATWCGPCKGEMPFMKEIEEEYKNNNEIVFMAISVDKAKDKQKWVDYIRKENLRGVHLLDNVGLAFANKHQINAIPRFMLIDKRGNWVEVRCPRPSSKVDLKRYLDKALGEDAVSVK